MEAILWRKLSWAIANLESRNVSLFVQEVPKLFLCPEKLAQRNEQSNLRKDIAQKESLYSVQTIAADLLCEHNLAYKRLSINSEASRMPTEQRNGSLSKIRGNVHGLRACVSKVVNS